MDHNNCNNWWNCKWCVSPCIFKQAYELNQQVQFICRQPLSVKKWTTPSCLLLQSYSVACNHVCAVFGCFLASSLQVDCTGFWSSKISNIECGIITWMCDHQGILCAVDTTRLATAPWPAFPKLGDCECVSRKVCTEDQICMVRMPQSLWCLPEMFQCFGCSPVQCSGWFNG